MIVLLMVLSLVIGNKFFWSDGKWNCHLVVEVR